MKAPRQHQSVVAFTFIEMLVVIVTMLVLAAMFLPFLIKEKARAQRISCTGRLKQIGLGFRQWAMDNTDRRAITATTFTNGLGNLNVSYFVGLDADETQPQMFLAGDDNFIINGQPARSGIAALTTNTTVGWADTRPRKRGNVGLADGSVQGFSSVKLQGALGNTGVDTNRLLLP